MTSHSEQLFLEASEVLPGGVNSPVRSFRAVGGVPKFIHKASGSKLTDVDGKTYVDFMCSWGAIILGHADKEVTEAIYRAAQNGASYGAPHENETLLARELIDRVPGLEMLRFVSSGTEACMSALRLARAVATPEKPITVKFEGCYHGHIDALLAKAGSGVATLSLPDSAGVPKEASENTLILPYGDLRSLEEAFQQHGDRIGVVILEPVAGNMGLIASAKRYIVQLRQLCDRYASVLIFDEVMSGFRVTRGGAVCNYEVQPDLYCFAKVIGGGLPVGAYGGSKSLMQNIAPLGAVYQAGTLSGNPIGMAAGLATMKQLTPSFYNTIEERLSGFEESLRDILKKSGRAFSLQRAGAMMSVFFGVESVQTSHDIEKVDRETYRKLFHALLEEGVYLPPSALEAWFVTGAHTSSDYEFTLASFARALGRI